MYGILPPEWYLYAARLETSFAISGSENTRNGSGTGFFVNYQGFMFFITNRHNVDYDFYKGEKTGYVLNAAKLFAWGRENKSKKFFRKLIEFKNFEFKLLFSDNEIEDVAVMLVKIVSVDDEDGMKWIVLSFDFDDLATEHDFVNSFPGEPVLMSGYSILADVENNMPIARQGTFASLPSVNYRNLNEKFARRIAVELLSSSGMSGSPVTAFPRSGGGRIPSGFIGANSRREYVVGINAANYSESYISGQKYNSSVSCCFKSKIIREIITRLVAKQSK
jgi:hypothetical protein